MKPRPILKPHHEQDGWVYVRVASAMVCPSDAHNRRSGVPTGISCVLITPVHPTGCLGVRYTDEQPTQRVISSRKTEEAVETWEYLQRCADEGLAASRHDNGVWMVLDNDQFQGHGFGELCLTHVTINMHAPHGIAPTLREAYWRYKAQAKVTP